MTSTLTSTSFTRGSVDTDSRLRIAGFQRAGMLDWPGRVTATVFLGGCNLRCPYCHNPELVAARAARETPDELLAHIQNRRAWLDGVVVTGGEPCAEPLLPELLATLKAAGMPVKLDTNGTFPQVLCSLLDHDLVDFVAMDIKGSPGRYARATGVPETWPAVEASLRCILESGVDHEFRTTCYPVAVAPDDLTHIAARLAGGRRYVLQQFRPQRTLDSAAISVKPYAPQTLTSAAARCSMFIPTVVRGAS
jgi:pyruvate formate lyase activating enzyme